MKKDCLSLIALMIFGLSCFYSPLLAQGFYTPTAHSANILSGYFETSVDGYQFHYMYETSNNTEYQFGNLQLNTAGEEIAWDSVARPSSNVYTKLLPDHDIIEIRDHNGGSDWQVEKLHLDGTVVWSYVVTPAYPSQRTTDVQQNDAGEVFLIGYEFEGLPESGASNMIVYKFQPDGALAWSLIDPKPLMAPQKDYLITPAADGGALFTESTVFENTSSTIGRISPAGIVQWRSEEEGYLAGALENSAGEIFHLGVIAYPDDNPNDVFTRLEKRDASGQLLWSKDINTSFQKESVYPLALVLGQNEDVLLVGAWETVFGQPYQHFFTRFDEDGTPKWTKHYTFLEGIWENDIVGKATPDNGFILATDQLSDPYHLAILKMDEDGNIFPGHVSGQIVIDANVNCQLDAFEQALPNWTVQLVSPDFNLYTTSDSSGHYEIADVPGGNYQLSAMEPSNLWESCAGSIPVDIPDSTPFSLVQHFPIQPLVDCPFMTVDVATQGLRRCFPNNFTVQYCNKGTVTATDVVIQIQLDPALDFDFADIPFTQNGDTLTFTINAVQALECGSFHFSATVNCEEAELGQTLCVNAHISPDSICNPPLNWSGALLSGSGICLGDSVRFELHNIGTAPTSPGLGAYVVDEHVIMFQQTLPVIAPNNAFNITVPAHGSTWRLLAEQEPNAPGREKPSIGVEGCGVGGPAQLGFILQFANRDGNPFSDQDCHEVVGSFDPNDKMAFPIGVGEEHFIEAEQPIDYQIRFQNTGTDTAFTVVVKDTLSPWLDPASVRPGASSHPYTWTLSREGILTFTFEHILLPDSNTNEAASHGFLQFNIEQRKDLAAGTRIENRAGIYFDFNEPVMTNTVFHTIGLDLALSSPEAPNSEASTLEIWPNPAVESTTISSGKPFEPGQYLLLRNSMGQVLSTLAAEKTLRRAGLPPGLYLVELHGPNGQVATGKVVWTR